jgi:formimidoylglutamate deiminase
LGVPSSHVLDALVFSSPDARFSDVFVAGKHVLARGQIANNTDGSDALRHIRQDFVREMKQLWV